VPFALAADRGAQAPRLINPGPVKRRGEISGRSQRVQLAAGKNHLGIDEGGARLGEAAAMAKHRRGAAAPGLLLHHRTCCRLAGMSRPTNAEMSG
jgi:hypothetical protein